MYIQTYIYTWVLGKYVGSDEFGNRYYRSRLSAKKRWVIYKGVVEPSKISSIWFNWVHGVSDVVPQSNRSRYPWQKPRLPNLTGTKHAYFPPGHVFGKALRGKATGDYQPWRPNYK